MTAVNVRQVVESKSVIIFDLFHTLTSLESTWGDGRPLTYQMLGISHEAWDEQLQRQSRDRLVGVKKDPVAIIAEMAHAIDPSIPDAVIQAAVENRIARFAAALIHMPQQTCCVLQTLKAKGKRIGLISNADVMEVAAWNQCPVASLFDSTIFSCSAGCMKPEPQIYELSMRQLGVNPAQCLFVGDGGSDELRGARSLGITTVMIAGIIREVWPHRIAERQQYADFVIEQLSELVEVHSP